MLPKHLQPERGWLAGRPHLPQESDPWVAVSDAGEDFSIAPFVSQAKELPERTTGRVAILAPLWRCRRVSLQHRLLPPTSRKEDLVFASPLLPEPVLVVSQAHARRSPQDASNARWVWKPKGRNQPHDLSAMFQRVARCQCTESYEHRDGVEPTTNCLQNSRSAIELPMRRLKDYLVPLQKGDSRLTPSHPVRTSVLGSVSPLASLPRFGHGATILRPDLA